MSSGGLGEHFRSFLREDFKRGLDLAVLEIMAPTEQYLVSERWMAAFTASGSIWPRSRCLISTRVK